MSGGPAAGGEIYFEYTLHGTFAKVTAIDAATGIEASVVGPRAAAPAELERLALKKLNFIRQKRERPDGV